MKLDVFSCLHTFLHSVCATAGDVHKRMSLSIIRGYRLVLMKMAVFFILENRFLLQISFVSGVRAQHTARKSDRAASSSKETTAGDGATRYAQG